VREELLLEMLEDELLDGELLDDERLDDELLDDERLDDELLKEDDEELLFGLIVKSKPVANPLFVIYS
jgi:hypothetical protein